jgi:peptidoglycan hydrolase-like protein with peptidoglycan-binding domain
VGRFKRLGVLTALALGAALLLAAPAAPMGTPAVAALQVALRQQGLYGGTIDGVEGERTRGALRTLQRRTGLTDDGVVGPRTRRALGRLGRHPLGSRALRAGAVGWDVSSLQFLLAWHGFPSGSFDGVFGPRLRAALRGYQTWAGLDVDGVAGSGTLASLGSAPPHCPLQLAWPLHGRIGDGFGPRSDRFHAGVDIPARPGAPVRAARAGRVVYAGWAAGGFGQLVSVTHENGVVTMYAHLSRIRAKLGEWLDAGERIGRAGSTGDATGPHLHFEVRVRGAAVDPLPALA